MTASVIVGTVLLIYNIQHNVHQRYLPYQFGTDALKNGFDHMPAPQIILYKFPEALTNDVQAIALRTQTDS